MLLWESFFLNSSTYMILMALLLLNTLLLCLCEYILDITACPDEILIAEMLVRG